MLALLLALGLFVIGAVFLILGADWFLDGARDLAHDLGISALVVGVLLAGLEPEEMLTAAIASARGAPKLAIGNVIGTNMTIVTLALGLSALIFPRENLGTNAVAYLGKVKKGEQCRKNTTKDGEGSRL